jgi:hypothetical protein
VSDQSLTGHALTLDIDRDGWDIAYCKCGWKSEPMPDVETAAEFYAQHVLDEDRRQR